MSEQKPMIFELSRNLLIILLLALVFGIFIVSNKVSYIIGLLLGGGFSILKIFMMEYSLNKAMRRNPESAVNYIRGQYIVRFLLTFGLLYIGIITPAIHFIGLAIGLLALKPAAYIQGKLEPVVPKDGSVEFLEWEEEDEDEKSDFW